MARVTAPFIGGRQLDRSLQVNSQRAVNLYPSLEGDGAKSLLTLLPTPGLILDAESGSGECRSVVLTLFQDNLYWVNGGELLKMDTALTITSVGTLNTTSGLCYAAAGKDYLLVVDGTDGYSYDGATFAVVADADFPANPSYCGFLDGFFICLDTATDVWQKSATEDPTDWDPLEFATAEAEPDDAVAIASSYRDLYIIGTITTQVYYNSSNPDFPFELYSNGVLEFGTPAPASVSRAGGNIFMLAQHKQGGLTILRVNGFQAQRIADPDIAYTLSQMTATSYAAAEGFAYTEADQTFYEITFPAEALTLVFHVEQAQWHERRSGTAETGRHRVRGYGYFNNAHYLGDYQNGRIYRLDATTYTENGATILRQRTMGALHRDGLQLECNSFEIEFKRGVGLATGQGSDPVAMLEYSNDGGNTWSAVLRRDIGKIGEYRAKAIWNCLGQGEDYRFRVSVTDPVETIIVSAYADMNVLAA